MWTASAKQKSLLRKFKISAVQRAFVDLVLSGWDEKDVYLFMKLYNPIYADDYNAAELRKFLEDGGVSSYRKHALIEQRDKWSDILLRQRAERDENGTKGKKTSSESGGKEGTGSSSSSEKRYRDKDEVIDELASTVKDLHGKDKADVLMKIADLQQMKKEKDDTREKTVHFYLPLKCDYCPLHIKFMERKRTIEENGRIMEEE